MTPRLDRGRVGGEGPRVLEPSEQAALVAWYDRVARDLPWRRTRDPYAIWVSEVMLQQTRVDTVIPYYQRFLERFPTAAALADAPEDEVLAAWSGLGYYRRARLLQAGAQAVVADHGGEVPRDPSARRRLPGVGPYTAGAIGSIAFDLPEPIVDGNVARVLARFHEVETPLGRSATERRLWELARAAVDGFPRPGALNQALMELGATVCLDGPRPRCGDCPIAGSCRARRVGRQGELPVPKPRPKVKDVDLLAVVPRAPGDGGSTWLARGEGRLFGGLWGPLLTERPATSGSPRARNAAALLARHRLQADELAPGEPVRHVLTHRRLRVATFVAWGVRGSPSDSLRTFAPEQLASIGISRLGRKVLAAVPVSPTAPGQLRVLIDS
ncbi:MAG TPA: A/G-specific adenine glycosylase [Polyangiaceae bacterium LLY-WYZ-14_1]|nr:A/G-specific adenine glycosylase [Polyangiaceae bacterium LLY-WYZ-14_1]